MTEPYPLQWPDGWPRTPDCDRGHSRFTSTLARALRDTLAELERLGASNVVVSSNLPQRHDGKFYTSATTRVTEPNDSGVAAYFQWRGKPYVIACDNYLRVWENLRAVGKTIEAMRTIERHGATQLLERAVSGFSALPPGASTEEEEPSAPWWEVLGVAAIDGQDPVRIAGDPRHPLRGIVLKLAEGIYRQKIVDAHPDKPGGSADKTRELNLALEQARRTLQ